MVDRTYTVNKMVKIGKTVNKYEMERELRKRIIEEMRRELTVSGPTDDREVFQRAEDSVLADPAAVDMTFEEKRDTVERIFFAIRKDMDFLHKYMEDPKVSEIMVNGKEDIFIEREGKLIRVPDTFDSVEDLEEVMRRAAAKMHREINELKPIVDARLEDGSRVNAVYKNIAINGPSLTVRKFPKQWFTMEDMIAFGTVTAEAAAGLRILVESGYNIFISGGTSSGKTSLLNALCQYIPAEERVIVMEDSAELQLDYIENIVRMECRMAGSAGTGEVNMSDLIKTSLRMRPDRIIVGEVRGREVMDMIQAMNTGHDGSLSTGHGNSIRGMLKRLETMFLQAAEFPVEAIRAQIAEGIDIMIHLAKMSDNSRKVLEIAQVAGMEEGNIVTVPLFKYSPDTGLKRTEEPLLDMEKIELRKGIKSGHGL